MLRGAQLVEGRLQHDRAPLHREMPLGGGKLLPPPRLAQRDGRAGVAPDSAMEGREGKRVRSHSLTGLADQSPPVSDGDGDRSFVLAGLDEDRKLQLCRSDLQDDQVAVHELEPGGEGGRDRRYVFPGDLADRVGQLLQPGIVGMPAVAEGHALVEVQLPFVGSSRCRRTRGILDDGLRHAPEALAEARHRRVVPGRCAEDADLERAIPERVEIRVLALPGKQLRAPELAQVRVVAGLLFPDPSEQALLRRSGIEERRDERLGQAEL